MKSRLLGQRTRSRRSKRKTPLSNVRDRYMCIRANGADGLAVDSLSAEEFQAGMTELSRDIIVKEQQIEYLISMLPGLENSEKDQERVIRELEEDLKAAEIQRQEALKERDQILAELDRVIQSIRRP